MSSSDILEATGDDGQFSRHDHGTRGRGPNGEAGATPDLRENARAVADALRDARRGAAAALSAAGDGAYQMSARTSAQIARQVESQPMASVLAAAGFGVIAGAAIVSLLLSRR